MLSFALAYILIGLGIAELCRHVERKSKRRRLNWESDLIAIFFWPAVLLVVFINLVIKALKKPS